MEATAIIKVESQTYMINVMIIPCRVSDDNIEQCYKILIHQLSQKHSEIREAAFAICCELFQRSHRFRESVADDFRCFSELVFGHEAQSPLPPPKVI